ncbi:MAG TPA: hypothetical protein VFE65_31705 [Pseudonocardia sp.]|jgi:hypothetical protein|nr:hypothetical protein [Pseudonocardia sp.]
MSTVIMQRWDALAPEQYDELRELVGWDRAVPPGMQFHVACYDDGILRMLDVFDSEAQFDSFVETRIIPGLQKLGIDSVPEKIVAPVHELSDVRGTAV